MNSLGTLSYSIAVVTFILLAILLVTRSKRDLHLLTFSIAILASIVWSGLAAYLAAVPLNAINSATLELLEFIRNISWIIFLQILLLKGNKNSQAQKKLTRFFIFTYIYFSIVIIVLIYFIFNSSAFVSQSILQYRELNQIGIAALGLFLIEQVIRQVDPEQRWTIKYLCFGLGGLFTYDFYMFGDALMLRNVDEEIWVARGIINALVVPFLMVYVLRSTNQTLRFFVSHKVVFQTTALLAGGLYLFAMGVGGYYIKLYGGDWGRTLQVVFLFLAAIILTVLLFSGSIRSSIRVLLGKHFFQYRYDYREEWLRITETLSSKQEPEELYRNALWAIANIVESPAGMLWIAQDTGDFSLIINRINVNLEFESIPQDDALVQYLQHTQWIIDIDEYKSDSTIYNDLLLANWILDIPDIWLVVPLMYQTQLLGFVVLTQARSKYKLNWEVRDILRTAGRQVAGYLALLAMNSALESVRQFEAFNRLSAFVVHDLKNIVAQLALVERNAQVHKNNPQFIDDAVSTIANANRKMNRLLSQLRTPNSKQRNVTQVELVSVLEQVVKLRSVSEPVPELEKPNDNPIVYIDRDGLGDVLEHLVQNAQEATKNDGFVRIRLYTDLGQAKIEIIDNGCGMLQEFILEKLFKPFHTTKGNAGMGIGVYEAREFIRSFGGRIEVKSKVGEGTTFIISLPVSATTTQLKENA